jgi:O-antigen ligase
LFGIASRQWNNGLMYWVWQPLHGGAENGFGPFVNRNHFAGWMLMASCLTIGFQLGQLEGLRKRAGRDWRDLVIWLSSAEAAAIGLTTIGLLVMVVSLVWTMSRSGISAFVVAVVCFVWLVLRRKGGSAGQRVSALGLVALLLFAGIGWRGPAIVGRWFGDTRDINSRFTAWQDGWTVIADFPLVGTGMNTYPVAMLFYQRHNLEVFMSQAHNDYLQLAAEGGLLVVIPAAALGIAVILSIRRNLAAVRHESRGYWIRAGAAVGLISIAVQELAEFSLQMPANAFLFCTLVAIALTPGLSRSPAHSAATS